MSISQVVACGLLVAFCRPFLGVEGTVVAVTRNCHRSSKLTQYWPHGQYCVSEARSRQRGRLRFAGRGPVSKPWACSQLVSEGDDESVQQGQAGSGEGHQTGAPEEPGSDFDGGGEVAVDSGDDSDGHACEPFWISRRVCWLLDLRGGGHGCSLPVMVFELNGREVPDQGVESLVVAPVDPASDVPFHGSAVAPGRSAVMDGFGCEQADRAGGTVDAVFEQWAVNVTDV